MKDLDMMCVMSYNAVVVFVLVVAIAYVAAKFENAALLWFGLIVPLLTMKYKSVPVHSRESDEDENDERRK